MAVAVAILVVAAMVQAVPPPCDLECENRGQCQYGSLDPDVLASKARQGVLIQRCICGSDFAGVGCEISLESQPGCSSSQNSNGAECDRCALADAVSMFAGAMCRQPFTEYCSGRYEDGATELSFCTNGGKCGSSIVPVATAERQQLSSGPVSPETIFDFSKASFESMFEDSEAFSDYTQVHAGCVCPRDFYGPHCEFLSYNQKHVNAVAAALEHDDNDETRSPGTSPVIYQPREEPIVVVDEGKEENSALSSPTSEPTTAKTETIAGTEDSPGAETTTFDFTNNNSGNSDPASPNPSTPSTPWYISATAAIGGALVILTAYFVFIRLSDHHKKERIRKSAVKSDEADIDTGAPSHKVVFSDVSETASVEEIEDATMVTGERPKKLKNHSGRKRKRGKRKCSLPSDPSKQTYYTQGCTGDGVWTKKCGNDDERVMKQSNFIGEDGDGIVIDTTQDIDASIFDGMLMSNKALLKFCQRERNPATPALKIQAPVDSHSNGGCSMENQTGFQLYDQDETITEACNDDLEGDRTPPASNRDYKQAATEFLNNSIKQAMVMPKFQDSIEQMMSDLRRCHPHIIPPDADQCTNQIDDADNNLTDYMSGYSSILTNMLSLPSLDTNNNSSEDEFDGNSLMTGFSEVWGDIEQQIDLRRQRKLLPREVKFA